MNWDRIEGDWKQFSGRAKAQWSRLTDDDLGVIDGSREQLEGKLQARYGYAKDQVRREVDNWLNAAGENDDVIAAKARDFADATALHYDRTLTAIRHDPLQSVAVAAAAGFIAAVVLRRF